MRHFVLLVFLLSCSLFVGANKGNSRLVLDKALCQFMSADGNSTRNSFEYIHHKWFGFRELPKPKEVCAACANAAWPNLNELSPLIQTVLASKKMIFGANSVNNVPKRFNATSLGNSLYRDVHGFEADIAAALANIIGSHYGVDGGIESHFYVAPWFASPTDNIITHLQERKFDFLLSGMSVDNTWNVGDGKLVPRTDLIDFSCAYQDDSEATVKGPRAPPQGKKLETPSDVNQEGIIVCVHEGTAMETNARQRLTAATIRATTGPGARAETINGTCHIYVAPIINALWDAETHDNLTYIGPFVDGKALAIGLRKENVESSSIPQASIPSVSFLLTIVMLAILFVLG